MTISYLHTLDNIITYESDGPLGMEECNEAAKANCIKHITFRHTPILFILRDGTAPSSCMSAVAKVPTTFSVVLT